jgi:ABC-type lipoprotein release transport system permease subunit
MSIWNASFWKDAAERAIKTFAQTAAATLGGNATNLLSLDWKQVLLVSAGATLMSVLTSIASSPRDGTMSPASAAKPAAPSPEE